MSFESRVCLAVKRVVVPNRTTTLERENRTAEAVRRAKWFPLQVHVGESRFLVWRQQGRVPTQICVRRQKQQENFTTVPNKMDVNAIRRR